ncbi:MULTISPECIES: hypothetical protein [Sulfitobacter]|uniref:hypothetical protein n=1 Tax=Sulfitobacter TaxID=60136 RepID=UPI000A8446A3|nr:MULTISPECIES: hypothetical protein [unclassified Sulfitobacter]ULO19555.1 hypothetical protein IV89_002598 [Sulfitobacter sp. CB2047]|tara:strand:- start:165 stop:329 length:165 start_codon:yes stop_codon:yes gene_type:complete
MNTSVTSPAITEQMTDFDRYAPRPAPLDMPRQVLEHDARPSLFEVVSRIFMRNA